MLKKLVHCIIIPLPTEKLLYVMLSLLPVDNAELWFGGNSIHLKIPSGLIDEAPIHAHSSEGILLEL